MLRFEDPRVGQVMVGLNRVGIVGLDEALEAAAASGLADREAIVDRVMDLIEADNYIHDRSNPLYRTALWREYRRRLGKDISDLFSEIEVTVRGDPGPQRDRFVETLQAVLGRLELKPVINLEVGAGPGPSLVIHGETIARGPIGRAALDLAVRKSISDW